MSDINVFYANNGDYSDWHLTSTSNQHNKDIEIEGFDPLKLKVFTGDSVCSDGTVKKTSPIRIETNYYPGILALKSPTYGRHSNKKFLYKCVPSDKSMPIFLVPYDIKTKQVKKISRFVNDGTVRVFDITAILVLFSGTIIIFVVDGN